MIRVVLAFGLFIVSFVTATHAAAEKSAGKGLTLSCGTYPEGLKTLKECCKAPQLFNYDLAHACEHICEPETGDKEECAVECLLTNNKLMRRKEVNNTAIAFMYSRFGMIDPAWNPIIEAGLAICKFEPAGAKGLVKQLHSFERCMFRHFRKNCIEFNEPVACEPVEEFMLKCLKVTPNCTTWPSWIVKVPELCCNINFGLFDPSLISKSEEACSKEMSNLGLMQCMANAMLKETKILVDNQYDFALAKKMLIDNSKSNAKWTKPIEDTMKVCEKQVQDDLNANQSDSFVNFWFYECIKGSLGDFCPEFATDRKQCRRIKKFKEACPESIPPRRLLMVNGKMK